jgi:hypothetical protein
MALGFFLPLILQRVFSFTEDVPDLEFLHEFDRGFQNILPQFDGDSKY